MTRGLALDLAAIRVNAVAPGFIETPLWETFGPNWPSMAAGFGRVDEVAEAVLFLMNNEFVTGTILRIDGGGCLV